MLTLDSNFIHQAIIEKIQRDGIGGSLALDCDYVHTTLESYRPQGYYSSPQFKVHVRFIR